MLANGATLGYKTTSSASTYTNLPGLKEIPDLGVDPERVDNTCLTDSNMVYEMGIGDLGEITYVFKYDNSSATSPYRVLRGLEAAKTVVYWEETTYDGTKTTFTGQCSVKRTGGGVNDAINFELSIAVNSAITVTDPAAAGNS